MKSPGLWRTRRISRWEMPSPNWSGRVSGPRSALSPRVGSLAFPSLPMRRRSLSKKRLPWKTNCEGEAALAGRESLARISLAEPYPSSRRIHLVRARCAPKLQHLSYHADRLRPYFVESRIHARGRHATASAGPFRPNRPTSRPRILDGRFASTGRDRRLPDLRPPASSGSLSLEIGREPWRHVGYPRSRRGRVGETGDDPGRSGGLRRQAGQAKACPTYS